MKRFALIAVLAGILVAPSWSRAALLPSITVNPEQPIVGELAQITVEGMAIFGEDVECRTAPGATVVPFVDVVAPGTLLSDTVEVTAIGPDLIGPDSTSASLFAIPDDAIIVLLPRSPRNPTIWEGEIRFPKQGEWTLRMTRPAWSGDPTCIGHEIVVTALPGDGAATPAVATPAPTASP